MNRIMFNFHLSKGPSIQISTVAIVFVWCLFSWDVSAQNRFRNGYIVTHTGDTVKGLVMYTEGEKSSSTCTFKKAKGTNEYEYSPADIMGYGFARDKVYVSDTYDSTRQKVFFEVLVRGQLSLYKLSNGFWLHDSTGRLHELRNEAKVTYVKEVKYQMNTNEHIAVMNQLMTDCPVLKSNGRPVTLSERPITHVVEDYNKCKGIKFITYKALKPWVVPMVGISAILNKGYLNVTDYPGIVGDVIPSNDLFGGITFDVAFPRVSERLTFHSALFYGSTAFHNYYHSTRLGPTINYITIEYSQVKSQIGFRYNFVSGSTAPYFGLGASNTWHINPQSTWFTEELVGGSLIKAEQPIVTFKSNQFGLWASVGVTHRLNPKLEGFAEFRFEYTDGIIPNAGPFVTDDDEGSTSIAQFSVDNWC